MEKHRRTGSANTVENLTTPIEKPLQSWKEIAAYLERDERTTRRWEQNSGLPIRRHGEGPGSSVYAYPSELNAWRLAQKPKAAGTKPVSPFPPRSAVLTISVIALLMIIWFIKFGPILNPPNPLAEAAAGVEIREVLPGGGSEGGPSPDGQYFAFVDWDTGNIAIEDLATGEHRNLTYNASMEEAKEYALWCAISPDGTSVAYDWYLEDKDFTELRLIGLDGSNQRTILGSDFGTMRETVAWSSDGKYIATTLITKDGRQLGWISISDGSLRVLKTLPGRTWPGKLFHSPDNRHLAYSYPSAKNSSNFDIFLVSTDGSQKTTAIVKHPANERVLGWIPGRAAILFLSDRSGTWDVWLQEITGDKPIGYPPADLY